MEFFFTFLFVGEQITTKLDPFETIDMSNNNEKTLEKKINDINSFNNSNNFKELMNYFKTENRESKKEYKLLSAILKSVDTLVTSATTSTSVTLSVLGIALILVPQSVVVECEIILSNKVSYELVMQKFSKHRTISVITTDYYLF